jgi:hypothetical protein
MYQGLCRHVDHDFRIRLLQDIVYESTVSNIADSGIDVLA